MLTCLPSALLRGSPESLPYFPPVLLARAPPPPRSGPEASARPKFAGQELSFQKDSKIGVEGSHKVTRSYKSQASETPTMMMTVMSFGESLRTNSDSSTPHEEYQKPSTTPHHRKAQPSTLEP